MFRFFNYYRLLGIVLFLSGLQLTFAMGDFVILKYAGLFLIFVGSHDILTGRSMKACAGSKTAMSKENISCSTGEEETTDSTKGRFKNNKKNIGKFLKANTIIGGVTLAIAIIFFMSSGFIAKKIFNYSDPKYNYNYSAGLKADIPASTTSVVKFNNCSKQLLNDKVIIRVNSLESNTKSSSLNITVENNGVSDMQLFGSNKFELVDEAGNHFKFKQEDSIDIYESATKASKTQYRLVFEPLTNPAKQVSFNGQLWTTNAGVIDVPFSIEIK